MNGYSLQCPDFHSILQDCSQSLKMVGVSHSPVGGGSKTLFTLDYLIKLLITLFINPVSILIALYQVQD